MNNKKVKTICLASIIISIVSLIFSSVFSIVTLAKVRSIKEIKIEPVVIETTTLVETTTSVPEPVTEEEPKKEKVTKKVESTTVKSESVKTSSISEDDIELLALVTVAEAEGESEYGKRLVIDTILNRVDHPRFPNTIRGVVYQKNQFTSMWNGRTNRCVVTDDVRQLVREELASRTNSNVIFFQMGGYSKYGTPLFKEGCHYFSSY